MLFCRTHLHLSNFNYVKLEYIESHLVKPTQLGQDRSRAVFFFTCDHVKCQMSDIIPIIAECYYTKQANKRKTRVGCLEDSFEIDL